MKIALIAAALLLPLPAAAAPQWWMYQTHPVMCVPLAKMFQGTRAHVTTPYELDRELQREGSTTGLRTFKPDNGSVNAAEIDTMIQGQQYEIDLFTSRSLCMGWMKYELSHPDVDPTAPTAGPNGSITF